MAHAHGPWSESEDLIKLWEPGDSLVDLLKALCYPSKVATFKDELLFQNIEQVVAMIATYGHYGQIQLLVESQYIRVVLWFAHDLVASVSVELQVFGEPAEDALVRPDSTMFEKEVIKNRF